MMIHHYPLPLKEIIKDIAPHLEYAFLEGDNKLPVIIAKDLSIEEKALSFTDDPTSPEVDDSYYDPEGDILLFKSFLNYDLSLPPPTQGNYLPKIRKELKVCEAETDKSSINEPPEVELKDLPPHLEYAFLEGDNKCPS
ncbi:hypothetical protein Tco_0644409 [Tanacetum coccineum]